MKKILSYLLLCTGCLLSCDKALDVPPQNIIQDEAVFGNESAIEAYIAGLYYDMPVEDFNFSATSGFNQWISGGRTLAHLSDEAIANRTDNSNGIGDGTWLNWWGYAPVRNANYFIEKIKDTKFPDEKKNSWLGEVKFLRAYYYFAMVKRYGGVPLLTEVQNFTGDNLEDLKVPRNKEVEVYDFINSELTDAAGFLPETSVAGRANKYVALSLKSRAMVYAASEAKYGKVALDGVAGIASTEANRFWQAAFDASAEIMKSGKYSLYAKNANKAQNFQDLFFDDDNPEVILKKLFQYPQKTHSYDLWNLPYSVRSPAGYSSRLNPTLDLVESFEYTDGTPGKLKLNAAGGAPIEYKDPKQLFANKDPRFFATIIYPFDSWKSSVIDVRAGIITASGETVRSGSVNGMEALGQNGIGNSGGEVTQTGFYTKKYLNPAYERSTVNPWTSAQFYIDFRLAEIILINAEAAMELGKKTEATSSINLIRERAGIRALNASEVTVDKIRHEIMVEFAFEGRRYWDIRRWRIADNLLNNRRMRGIEPYYVEKSGAYIFKDVEVGFVKTFPASLYYEKINTAEISKNSKLVQNPNY
jgi:starch-binding outer membrane protein, SusD/RagB family